MYGYNVPMPCCKSRRKKTEHSKNMEIWKMNELNVKVGDKVLLTYSAYCKQYRKIVEVINVTPTGRIKVEGVNIQFDKYGRRMGKRDFSSEFYQISFVTEEQIAEILENQKRNSIINKAVRLCQKVNEKNLTYEQALKLIGIFENI